MMTNEHSSGGPTKREKARLAPRGQSSAAVFAELFTRKSADADWHHGRTFNLVYPTGRSDLDELLIEANMAYVFENALNPLKFPSLGSMQRDVVEMTSALVRAPDNAGASFSSGGTESIFLSVLVSRERARAEKGITKGNIVFPESAHPAFAKAAFYTGLEIRPTALDAAFTADVGSMRDAMDENTVLCVGSAYGNPHGIIDPIDELSALALSREIPFHSDSCIGAFVLPFMERLGYDVPPFDFRLEGVTQMSCDVHKYGYSTKGASVVVYREEAWLTHQTFDYDIWPSGRYRTASMAGARAASPIAAAWATMRYLGEEGYLELMSSLMATTEKIRNGIASIDGLRVLGNPIGPLLTFTSDSDDIFAIGDVMDDRRWNLNRTARPHGLHMMISPLHANYADEFLQDLSDAVRHHGPSRGIGAGYNERS